MNNLFLTGDQQIGKSTIVKRVIKMLDNSIGGYLTSRNFVGDEMVFTVLSLYDRTSNFDIAKINRSKSTKKIYLNIFREDLIEVLDKSLDSRDLIVLDELGFMEENVTLFKEEVMKLLDSPTPVLGVLKKQNTPFLNEIRSRDDISLIEVDEDNRDSLDEELIHLLKGFGLEFKDNI